MMKTVAMNFVNDKKFSSRLWICLCKKCSAVDTMSHLKWCGGYAHLHEGLGIDNDHDLVTFFKLVIKEREDNDNYDECGKDDDEGSDKEAVDDN